MADYDKTPSYALAGALGLLGTKPVIAGAPYVSPKSVGDETIANAGFQFPEIRDLAKKFSKFETNQLLKSWDKLMPGFSGLRDQATALSSSYMKGEIPADVLKSIQDSIAAAAAGRGTTGSTFQLADSARSLGLTSLDLSKAGTSMFGNLANMFMPYAPLRGIASQLSGALQPMNVAQTGALKMWNEQNRFNTEMMENVKDAMPSPASTALANAWGQIDADIQDFFKSMYGGKMGGMGGGGPGGGGGGGGGEQGPGVQGGGWSPEDYQQYQDRFKGLY